MGKYLQKLKSKTSEGVKPMNSSLEKNNFGVDKIKAYGWIVKDQPGVMQPIKKTMLRVDDTYQRDAFSSKVLRITSEWSWVACGVIVVGKRENNLFVIDGQHRVLAAMKRSDIEFLPCIIFETEGTKEEATAFLNLNANRKPISSVSKLKAMAAAGDPIANFVTQAVNAYGLKFSQSSHSEGDIKCVAACIKLAEADKDEFLTVLDLTVKASVGCPIYERVLRGLNYLHKNIEGGLQDRRLASRIIEVGAKRLAHAANNAQAFYGKGGEKVWANGIIEEINKGLRYKFQFTGAKP